MSHGRPKYANDTLAKSGSRRLPLSKNAPKNLKRKRRLYVMRQAQKRYHTSVRAEARATGFCVHCYKYPADVGVRYCRKCRETLSAYQRQRRRNLPDGVCQRCKARANEEGYRTCKRCRLWKRNDWRRRHSNTTRDVSPSDILRLLGRARISLYDVTAELGVAHRTTLRHIAALEDAGLIVRWICDDDDPPVAYCRLTAAGKAAVNRLADEVAAEVRRAV